MIGSAARGRDGGEEEHRLTDCTHFFALNLCHLLSEFRCDVIGSMTCLMSGYMLQRHRYPSLASTSASTRILPILGSVELDQHVSRTRSGSRERKRKIPIIDSCRPTSLPAHLAHRSGASSNLGPKMDTPAHRNVVEFVRSAESPSTAFTLDGQRGSGKAKLCRVPLQVTAGARPGRTSSLAEELSPNSEMGRRLDCVEIALEGTLVRFLLPAWEQEMYETDELHRLLHLTAKDLFAMMQRLNFFCQLPHNPTKTHIVCEKIPQS